MGLLQFIGRRVTFYVAVLLGIIALDFLIFQVLLFLVACPNMSYIPCAIAFYFPESPIRYASGFPFGVTPFGFNLSPWMRILNYYRVMFTLDFGYNVGNVFGGSVIGTIANRFPYTALLVGSTTVATYLLGSVIGLVSPTGRGKPFNRHSLATLLSLNAFPLYMLGGILILGQVTASGLFYVPLGTRLIGVSGWDTYIAIFEAAVLPFLTLMLAGLGSLFQIQRTEIMDTLREDFIPVATEEGWSARTTLYSRTFRNDLLPVAMTFPFCFAAIISWDIIIETLFQWPGLGLAVFYAISSGDVPYAQAYFFIVSLVVLEAFFIADVARGILDPKARGMGAS